VRRPAPPAIARLTRLIVSAATADRAACGQEHGGTSCRPIPTTGFGASRPLFAANAGGRMGDAIGNETLSEGRAFHPSRGRTPLDATITPERFALESCRAVGRARYATRAAATANWRDAVVLVHLRGDVASTAIH
jgi:hypothetical protein